MDETLKAWAKAYRDSPEHRFPCDPHAEFFPADMEDAAAEIERLRDRAERAEAAMENEAIVTRELRAALKAIAELRCEDLYYGPDADGVDNTAAALAHAALNHEQKGDKS